MNRLARAALRKAEQRVEHLMQPGEGMIEFDIGRAPAGQVAILASNQALYFVDLSGSTGMAPPRLPYEEVAHLHVGGSLFTLRTDSGGELTVDLGRGVRKMADVVKHQVEMARRVKEASAPKLRAEGHYLPLLMSEMVDGGPGMVSIETDGPVFITEGGVRHAYGWSYYVTYTRKEDGTLIIHTNPGDGAEIHITLDDPTPWINELKKAGLTERN